LNNIFSTRRDWYKRAAKEAEATYNLEGAEEPVFVRWVTSPQQVQDDYWRVGIGFLVATVCIYLLLSIIAGAILQMWSKRTATSQGGSGGGDE